MKKWLLFLIIFRTLVVAGQSADEQVGELINQGDWLELQRVYPRVKDSLSPFPDAFAGALLSSGFNRPDAVTKLDYLLQHFNTDLGSDNFLGLGLLISKELSKSHLNAEAAGVIGSLMEVFEKFPEEQEMLKSWKRLYQGLMPYKLYQVNRPEKDVIIPLQLDSVGKGGVLFALDGEVNGLPGRYIFDTGASANVITPALARKYKLVPVIDSVLINGLNKDNQGQIALADSIKIGEITIRNVVFTVLDMKAGDPEADRHFERIQLFLGFPLLNALKEIQLDFRNRQLIFPQRLTPRPMAYSNILLNDRGLITIEAQHEGKRMLFHLDSGSVLSSLSGGYYTENEKRLKALGGADSVRLAGAGGIVKSLNYWDENFSLSVAGNEAVAPRIMVIKDEVFRGMADNVFGADLFLCFPKVILNVQDMFMETVETKK